MKICAIAPWFGSKRTLAPIIVQELGQHRCYWEPFCGAMSVLLAKPAAAMETVNDLHGDLINMARCIQHERYGPALYRRLRRTLACETLMDEAAARWKQRGNGPAGEIDVDRAYDFFFSSWMGRNGVSGTKSYNQGFSLRYTKNGGHSARRWVSAVDSIAAWRERLRHVTICNRDGFDLLGDGGIEDAEGVSIYLDPPYVEKGATYVYDFTAADHVRLRDAAARFKKTRVVISYYEHPTVRELYDGWTFRSCPTTKAMKSATAERLDAAGDDDEQEPAEKAPEILVMNGPSYCTAQSGGLWGAP